MVQYKFSDVFPPIRLLGIHKENLLSLSQFTILVLYGSNHVKMGYILFYFPFLHHWSKYNLFQHCEIALVIYVSYITAEISSTRLVSACTLHWPHIPGTAFLVSISRNYTWIQECEVACLIVCVCRYACVLDCLIKNVQN